MRRKILSIIVAVFFVATVFAIPVSASDNNLQQKGDSEYTWSSWSTSAPPSGSEYETKTQYSYRDKEYKYSGYSSISGYTQLSKELCSTDYSVWSVNEPSTGTTSDNTYTTEVTKQSATAQVSYCYVCSCKKWYHLNSKGAHKHSDGEKHYTSDLLKVYSSVSLPNSGYTKEYADGAYGYKCNKTYDTGSSYKLGTVYMLTFNGSRISSYTSGASVTWLWQTSGKTRTIYRKVTKKYRYKHWKWGEWSSWSDSYVESSSDRETRTRTLYRYKIYPEEQTVSAPDTINKTYSSSTFNLGASAKTELTYSSSNTNVASVSSTGEIALKGAGTAVITVNAAATQYYKAASKKVTINVVRASQTVKCAYSSEITKYCSSTAFPLKASSVTQRQYSSSNRNVASVDSEGNVKVKSPGTAVITIKAVQTSRYKEAVKQITVNAKLKKPVVSASKGDKKGQIKLKIKMIYGADEYIVYRYKAGYGYSQKYKITKTATANRYCTKERKYNSSTGKYYWSLVGYSKGLPTLVDKKLTHNKTYYYKVRVADNDSGINRISDKESAKAK